MDQSSSPGLLKRYFSGLTEQTFQVRLGVADPPLLDYIADLLVRFVRSDAVYRLRDLEGRPLSEVAEMMAEGQQRLGDARREALRHIGDFTLFWTGVYPEALSRMRRPLVKDHLIDYCQQGKQSYLIASRLPAPQERNDSEVLKRLSVRFEEVAFGLGEVRREWERREDVPPHELLT